VIVTGIVSQKEGYWYWRETVLKWYYSCVTWPVFYWLIPLTGSDPEPIYWKVECYWYWLWWPVEAVWWWCYWWWYYCSDTSDAVLVEELFIVDVFGDVFVFILVTLVVIGNCWFIDDYSACWLFYLKARKYIIVDGIYCITGDVDWLMTTLWYVFRYSFGIPVVLYEGRPVAVVMGSWKMERKITEIGSGKLLLMASFDTIEIVILLFSSGIPTIWHWLTTARENVFDDDDRKAIVDDIRTVLRYILTLLMFLQSWLLTSLTRKWRRYSDTTVLCGGWLVIIDDDDLLLLIYYRWLTMQAVMQWWCELTGDYSAPDPDPLPGNLTCSHLPVGWRLLQWRRPHLLTYPPRFGGRSCVPAALFWFPVLGQFGDYGVRVIDLLIAVRLLLLYWCIITTILAGITHLCRCITFPTICDGDLSHYGAIGAGTVLPYVVDFTVSCSTVTTVMTYYIPFLPGVLHWPFDTDCIVAVPSDLRFSRWWLGGNFLVVGGAWVPVICIISVYYLTIITIETWFFDWYRLPLRRESDWRDGYYSAIVMTLLMDVIPFVHLLFVGSLLIVVVSWLLERYSLLLVHTPNIGAASLLRSGGGIFVVKSCMALAAGGRHDDNVGALTCGRRTQAGGAFMGLRRYAIAQRMRNMAATPRRTAVLGACRQSDIGTDGDGDGAVWRHCIILACVSSRAWRAWRAMLRGAHSAKHNTAWAPRHYMLPQQHRCYAQISAVDSRRRARNRAAGHQW